MTLQPVTPSSNELDDATLISVYRRGDDEALRALVERHQAGIYRLALAITKSPEAAEDATQEALIAVLSALPLFRGDSLFTTWLYRITLNTCLKWKRRQSSRREAPLLSETLAISGPATEHPDKQAEQDWLREQVRQFLATVPESYSTPVVLSDVLDLPATEIASLLHLSLPATKSRIRRGRQQLRAEIERYCQETGIKNWQELVSHT